MARVLGEGSYGRVVAVDDAFVYKEQITSDVTSFLREVAALSFLQKHNVPGIVPFHGVVNNSVKLSKFDGDISNFHFVPITLKMFLYHLLVTLSHMDALGIVHCDIKLENTLYKIVDGYLQFALCDFGLSHFYGSAKEVIFNRTVQTTEYRCPEFEIGVPLDPTKIDIWSVGMMISHLNTTCDNELTDIATQMLEIDPVNRPTASMLLKSPIFDSFRDELFECSIKQKFYESDGITDTLTRNMYSAIYNKQQCISDDVKEGIANIAVLICEDSDSCANRDIIFNVMAGIDYDIYSLVSV